MHPDANPAAVVAPWLGGTTQDLLTWATLPVLLSHARVAHR
jgi:hypothetical protein